MTFIFQDMNHCQMARAIKLRPRFSYNRCSKRLPAMSRQMAAQRIKFSRPGLDMLAWIVVTTA
jgi:hypothetical protein